MSAVVLPTHDGGTVEITRCGLLVDIHVRDRSGRTVATVTRRAGEAARLLQGLSRSNALAAKTTWSSPYGR